MTSHRQRIRARLELEALEGRIALSHIGAAVDDGQHAKRGGLRAEVHALKHGADDPANHDAKDDRSGAADGVHRHKHGHPARTPAG
jgi:hypothetical protein